MSANILMPIGALLTSILVGWRLSGVFMTTELAETSSGVRTTCRWLLRYLCPLAIVAVLVATLI